MHRGALLRRKGIDASSVVAAAGYKTPIKSRILGGSAHSTKQQIVRIDTTSELLPTSAAARSVANSPLVKTAINGQDPNWGRIMMALGKSAARVDQNRVSIAFAIATLVDLVLLAAFLLSRTRR